MNNIRVFESFDHLPPSYLAIFDEAASSSAFFSLPWFAHLSKCVFPQEGSALILGVESADGQPLLALPLWRAHGAATERQLGAAANYYTPVYSPIVYRTPAIAEGVYKRLAQAIADSRPRWDVVNLQPMDPVSPMFAKLSDALRDAGMWVDSYFCFGNWYLEVDGRTYREYCLSLPSRLTNTLARKLKQANKVGHLKIDILVGDRDLDAGIEAYETVYNASWKISEPYSAFIPGLIRLCAEQGWLRLGIAWMDDRPVAAQLWIVSGGVASIYKLAYDQRHAGLSVGSLLTARLMEHVIDVDRVREVDFLSGDDSYKRDWMSDRRERHGIIAFNPRTVWGVLGALRHFGARRLREAHRFFRSHVSGSAAPRIDE